MGIDTQTQNGESDEQGIVNLKGELISVLEELEKCRRKNRQSNHVISKFESQLLEAKNIEEDLNLQLKRRIHYSERFEEEIMQIRKMIDEEAIKSKFENNSKVLDDILSRQRPLSEKYGLGYDKAKKPEYSSFTDQGGNKRSYVDVLKSLVKKEERKKSGPSSYDKKRTNEVSKISMKNRYQHIFLGCCYSCN